MGKIMHLLKQMSRALPDGRLDVPALAALWILSLVVANPVGDFPKGDDWSYGLAVRHLLETGDYRPTGWTAITLISQLLWGAAFCVPAGFSFNALRLSTLVLSFAGMWGTHALMRDLRQPRWLAFLGAATLGFCPAYFSLSCSFNSDVPYTSLVVLSVLFFVRFLTLERTRDWLLGGAFALAATFCRQSGVAIPIAFGFATMLWRGFSAKNVVMGLLPAAASALALIGFQTWLEETGRLPSLAARNIHLLGYIQEPAAIPSALANLSYESLLYLGWFLSPVLVFVVGRTGGPRGRVGRISLLAAILFMALMTGARALVERPVLMPVGKGAIVDAGIGVHMLRDVAVLGMDHVPALPVAFWILVTGVGLAGGAVLLSLIGCTALGLARRSSASGQAPAHVVTGFLLLTIVVHLLPMFQLNFFDRYLLPVITPILGIIAGSPAPSGSLLTATRRVTAAVAFALLLTFGVVGTRDHFVWDRLRWEALEGLLIRDRLPAAEIDGGFEFNGLAMYSPEYVPQPDKSWWWVQGDRYVIAFGKIPGYAVIREYPFDNWMPPYRGRVVVLRRIGVSDPGS
jgi:hypothetical protein